MRTNQEIILSSIPIESLAKSVSEIIIADIRNNIPVPAEKPKPEYLTRKQSYKRLGIAGQTFDSLIIRTQTEKLGTGKGAKFRKEDVEYIYENLNQLLYRRK